jgi:hypothetical protein
MSTKMQLTNYFRTGLKNRQSKFLFECYYQY